jgi:hypothetical protein
MDFLFAEFLAGEVLSDVVVLIEHTISFEVVVDSSYPYGLALVAADCLVEDHFATYDEHFSDVLTPFNMIQIGYRLLKMVCYNNICPFILVNQLLDLFFFLFCYDHIKSVFQWKMLFRD